MCSAAAAAPAHVSPRPAGPDRLFLVGMNAHAHIHMEQEKGSGPKLFRVSTVVRLEFAQREITIAREAEYVVTYRECQDRTCLGSEPEVPVR